MSDAATREPHRLVAATVGVAIPRDAKLYGYLSEHHSFGENEDTAGDYAEELAAEMLATTLGLEFDPDKSWGREERGLPSLERDRADSERDPDGGWRQERAVDHRDSRGRPRRIAVLHRARMSPPRRDASGFPDLPVPESSNRLPLPKTPVAGVLPPQVASPSSHESSQTEPSIRGGRVADPGDLCCTHVGPGIRVGRCSCARHGWCLCRRRRRCDRKLLKSGRPGGRDPSSARWSISRRQRHGRIVAATAKEWTAWHSSCRWPRRSLAWRTTTCAAGRSPRTEAMEMEWSPREKTSSRVM